MICRKSACLLLPALLPSLLLLSACGSSKQERDKRTASGEVLKGTISDAMIPLDTVTSQPPLVKVAPQASSSDAAPDEGDQDAATLDAAQPAVPPAAE